MAQRQSSSRYQVMLVGMLSLNFGILFFDRNALNFLMPFVAPDLHLSNTQIGALASALSLMWAISGFFVGGLSDRTGKRKVIIVIAGVLFSACSLLSSIAATFATLLGARLLMGAAEGGVMPVSHALVVEEVTPARRGLAMGVAQNLGSNLLGSSLAPILLVGIATAYGWRHAFYVAAIPGLISAVMIWFLIREPEHSPRAHDAVPFGVRAAFANRNVRLCAIIAVLLVSYLVVCWAFMPLFLTKVRGFTPDKMSWLMAVLGISAGVGSFIVPGVSDVIGRKPLMIGVPLLGVILPLSALFAGDSVAPMAVMFFLGWALVGLFPMFMATIPSESVGLGSAAAVTGLVMGTGEVLGGVLSPLAAGAAADQYGLAAPLWIMLVLCLVAGLVALGLTETAPSRIGVDVLRTGLAERAV